MKNIMNKKRIVCFIAIAMLLFGTNPFTTCAAEPQFGSSTVKYTVDDYFYVSIPETINVGTESTISAYETNIAPDKSIYVRIEGLDGDGYITLKNDYDSSQTLNVYFKDSNGERYSAMNNLIAQFGINPANETQTITFNSEPDTITPSTRAGSYSGQVYFSVVCE